MPKLKELLLRSGPCADSVTALRLYLAALRTPLLRWTAILSRLKFTPAVLDAVRASELPSEEKGALFSAAMTIFRSGPSFKTTAAGRTPLTDTAILGRLRPGSLLLETGVSDGSSSLALLEAAGGADVRLSDRQAFYSYADKGPFRIFYGAENGLLSVRLPGFYLCTGTAAPPPPPGARRVELLNPVLQLRFPAVRLEQFDVFSGRLERKADIIKCANVLNSAYFSYPEIAGALRNLSDNLAEGGWLFVSQNNARYPNGEAYLALRKEGASLILREEVNGHELLPRLRSREFAGLVSGAPGEDAQAG